MNLYQWNSDYLKSYRPGYILILAKDIAEARLKARLAFEEHRQLRLERGEVDFFKNGGWDKEFEKDISQAPIVVESGCLFLYGSD